MIIPPDINSNNNDINLMENIEASEELICKVDSDFSSICVVKNKYGKFLKFDDSYQSGIIQTKDYSGGIPYVNYFFLAPIFNPNIKKILILGMGTGNLAMEFLKLLPEIKKIDIVEIDPAVIEIAGQHFDFIPDERININIQDARVFVRNSKIKYDLIILDIFSEQGLSYRFMTREFFLEISRALSNNGILASNIFSLWDLNSEKNTVFKALFNTYKSVFNAIKLFPAYHANYVLYNQVFEMDDFKTNIINAILICSKKALKINKKQLEQGLNIEKYLQDMQEFSTNKIKLLRDNDNFDEDFFIENIAE